ncbi:MAG: Holliday junction branch migration protein RuvA [Chloroflexota bacterium]|nr:Holliday junction branch migration protein RuvA [Chloroflexota bacterium]
MIAGVRGILEQIGDEWIYINLSGLIFQVLVPGSLIDKLCPVGDAIHLFTHLRIRDEQPILYGFNTQIELELFQMLLSVSGVGPRIALGLISSLGVSGVNQAIESGDVNSLRSVSGVGGRTAGRLILELKGKFENILPEVTGDSRNLDSEVVAALIALGYSTNEARQAVQATDSLASMTVEEGIRNALMHLGR